MNSPVFVAWDTETSLHNTGEDAIGDFTADPHSPHNWIVWSGFGEIDMVAGTVPKTQRRKFPTIDSFALPPPPEGVVLVGHNIKYDLSMAMNPNNEHADEWRDWVRNPKNKIWDTQVAEFRLRGQWLIQPSLDTCSMLRGWEPKPGRLKEYWETGVSTEDIPDEEVEPYLDHDVRTTGHLFVDQLRKAELMGLTRMLLFEMDATMVLTDGEVNGMAFQKKAALDVYEGEMAETIAQAERVTAEKLEDLGVPPAALTLGSNPMLNTLIYGGTYKYEERMPLLDAEGKPVLFKTGKRQGLARFQIHKKEWNSAPLTRAKANGVDEETLVKIKEDSSTDKSLSEAIGFLLHWRKLRKQSADFTGYAKLTWDHDSLIHGSLNQNIVATARLSSSKPNLQNASKGPVRMHFVSRHQGGRIVEIDLSQIEVVVQAVLSGDERMLKDLHEGIDFHSKRAAIAAGVEYALVRQKYLDEDAYWMEKRDGAKIFSFRRAYGAGAVSTAAAANMTIAAVQELIYGEEREYPGIKAMTDRWETEVAKSAERIGDDVLGRLVSKTGSRYIFKREMFHGKSAFKPTTIKNYPIQGLAGDIIKAILSQLRATLYAWGQLHEVQFINTVHDSILFDVDMQDDELRAFSKEVVVLMTTGVGTVMAEFGLDFQGLINADVDVGSNWLKYHKTKNPKGIRAFNIEETEDAR